MLAVWVFIGNYIWGLVSMLDIKHNPNLRGEIANSLSAGIEEAALAAGLRLQVKVGKYSGKRTGVKYAGYPRRSSAYGEYPQEQSGSLKLSVDVSQISSLDFNVGFFGESISKLKYLEYTGNPALGGRGRRRPLYMLFEGKDSEKTLAFMATAARKAFG